MENKNVINTLLVISSIGLTISGIIFLCVSIFSEEKSNIRKLTPNECRKLQGFPSDWKQVVSDTQAYKQFGNAVTVDVSYNVAKNLMDYISENGKMGDLYEGE